MIFFSLNLARNSTDNRRTFRDYNRINYSYLQNTLDNLDWSLLYSITDSNVALDFFNNCIIQVFENSVPLRSPKRNLNAPWFNTDISNAMIARDIAYRQWTLSRSLSDHLQYKRLRNKVTQLVNKAKSDYTISNLERASSTKELWTRLKRLNVTGCSFNGTKFQNTGDEIYDYFGENFTRDPSYPPETPPNVNGSTFTQCNELEVMNALYSISSNAIGIDGIPLRFVKLILSSIITPITYLFNLFISTAKFPRAW